MPTIKDLRARRDELLNEAARIVEAGRATQTLSNEQAERVNHLTAEADQLSREIKERDGADVIDTSRRPKGESQSVRGDGRGRVLPDPLEELESRALRPEQRVVDWVRENRTAEDHGLALGDYLRAMFTGAKTDAEKRALSEGSDSAGGFTVPEILSSQLIDLLRARTVAIRAGARTVPLLSDTNHVAKLLTDPVPAWRSEDAAVAESDPTFGGITFSPKSLAVLIKASRELLDDSLNIRTELPRVIAQAMALELDRVALFGSGVDPEPVGLAITSGINEVALGTTISSYAPLINARTACLVDNAPNVSGFVMHPEIDGDFAGLTATDGQPLMKPEAIRDVPFLTSTSVPLDTGSPNDTSIITGWFPHLLIGIRNEVRIQVLQERYADNLQVGFLAYLRADIVVERAAAFCKISDVRTV